MISRRNQVQLHSGNEFVECGRTLKKFRTNVWDCSFIVRLSWREFNLIHVNLKFDLRLEVTVTLRLSYDILASDHRARMRHCPVSPVS